EHIGKRIQDVLPLHSSQLEAVLREVLHSGQPVLNYEMEYSSPSNENKWLLASYFPVKTGDGTIIGVGGAVMDITRQKLAELRSREGEIAIRETQERYDFALAAGRIGVWEMALDSRKFQWSGREYEIF